MLANSAKWVRGSVDEHATSLLVLFEDGWQKFAKTGPADGQFNKWWNAGCAQTKALYNDCPCMCTWVAFHAACKVAKKVYFACKLEDMVKHHKPWLGTHCIKDQPIPKVPQICTAQHLTIKPMFDAFQCQFQPSVEHNIDISHPFLQSLPEKPA